MPRSKCLLDLGGYSVSVVGCVRKHIPTDDASCFNASWLSINKGVALNFRSTLGKAAILSESHGSRCDFCLWA